MANFIYQFPSRVIMLQIIKISISKYLYFCMEGQLSQIWSHILILHMDRIHSHIDHKCIAIRYEKHNYEYSLWTENPLFRYYPYLMENVSDPVSLSEQLEAKKLFSTNQLDIVLNAPMDYMGVFYIFQHVCNMSLHELFTFLDVLKELDDYRHIYDKLTKGTYMSL